MSAVKTRQSVLRELRALGIDDARVYVHRDRLRVRVDGRGYHFPADADPVAVAREVRGA